MLRRVVLALALLGGAAAFQPLVTPRPLRTGVKTFVSPPPVIERGANSTVNIKVQVSAEDTLAAFESAAKEFAKGVDIRGFRKGSKIPTQVVVAQIGAKAIKSKAIDDLHNMATARVNQMNEVQLIGEAMLEHGEDLVNNQSAELICRRLYSLLKAYERVNKLEDWQRPKNQSGQKWKSKVDWMLGDMYFKIDEEENEIPEADDEVQEKLKKRALFNKHLSGAAESAPPADE